MSKNQSKAGSAKAGEMKFVPTTRKDLEKIPAGTVGPKGEPGLPGDDESGIKGNPLPEKQNMVTRYFRVKQDLTIKAGTVLTQDVEGRHIYNPMYADMEMSSGSTASFIINEDVLADRQDLFEEIAKPSDADLVSRILPSLEA